MKKLFYLAMALNASMAFLQAQAPIVLIFENAPINSPHSFREGNRVGGSEGEISYTESPFKSTHFIPKYGHLDTLVLYPKTGLTAISHIYKGLESWGSFFRPGDTAVFTYQELKPFVTLKNRQAKLYDLNLDYYLSQELYDGDLKTYSKCRHPSIFDSRLDEFRKADSKADFSQLRALNQKIMEECHETTLKAYDREMAFLDSLAKLDLMSSDIYEHYKLSHSQRIRFTKFYNSSRVFNQPIGPINQILSDYSDEGIEREGTFALLMTAINQKAWRQPKPGMQGTNYKAIYDTTAAIRGLGQLAKNQILSLTMNYLVVDASVSDIQLYLKKVEKDVTDTAEVNALKRRYGLNAKVSKQLALKHPTRGDLNLEAVLKEHLGKVVYVDFWATWCAPCVASLPASALLRETYADQEVVFVYISKDEQYDRWVKGTTKYGIANYNSFIIDNLHTSSFLDDIQLKTIPRYLIYDRAGKLARSNAPRPDDPMIHQVLQAYLGKR
jgi:thiol-disulfide isomerase/thioredoxin